MVARLSAWALLALGAALRLRQYLVPRSLWLDEAMLALNIRQRGMAELFLPLDYEQGAPLGFLLLTKSITLTLGMSELRLRLLPFLAALASLILFWLLSRRVLKTPAMLTALAWFALHPGLIQYAAEFKQYSTDVFFTLLLLWLAQNAAQTRRHAALAGTGMLAVWFSHPAIFVLAAMGVSLWLHYKKIPASLFFAGAGWLISFGAFYFLSLSSLAANQPLQDFWQEYFPASSAGALNLLYLWLGNHPLFIAVTLTGLVWGWLRHRSQMTLLLGLVGFSLLAAALHLYPFGGRMILFLAPVSIWLGSLAVEATASARFVPRWAAHFAAASLALTLCWLPLLPSLDSFLHPRMAEHIRPAMQRLQDAYKTGDVLYLYHYAVPAFEYYAPLYGMEEVAAQKGEALSETEMQREMENLPVEGRVWLLFSHVTSPEAEAAREAAGNALKSRANLKEKFIAPGSGVFLYRWEKTP